MTGGRRLAVALIHYPVFDRGRATVTSAITNIDLHDIARSAFTYGLSDFFVVHPIAAQRELARRIQSHWVAGAGGIRIPDRAPAMGLLRVVADLDEALGALGDGGEPPSLWTTSASPNPRDVLGFAAAREKLSEAGPPVLIALGTGWGLADEIHERAIGCLEPIRSPREDGYNHLSVRAAAAIIFERLRGVP